MLGNQRFVESMGQAINKSMDLDLFAVLQVGHDALEVSIVGHELPVSLAKTV